MATIRCDEFGLELLEDGSIYECLECDSVLCDRCRNTHNCLTREGIFSDFYNEFKLICSKLNKPV